MILLERLYDPVLIIELQRKKMGLVVIFGLGVLSIAGKTRFEDEGSPTDAQTAGCVRYDYVRMLATTSDQFYALADALNWCSIEAYVGKLTYEQAPLVYRTLT